MTTMTRSATDHRARLFLSQEEWDRLPERLEDPFFAALAERNREAIAWLDEDGHRRLEHGFDHADGDREPHRWHKARLVRYAVAWYLDRDDEMLERARRVIDQLLDAERWVPTDRSGLLRHYDLTVSEYCHDAAFALDVLGAQLDAATREALVRILVEVGLPAYIAGHDREEWWCRCDFNWASATHGNAGIAALAVRGHAPDLAQQVLVRALPGLRRVIDALPVGGGWTEGLMYCTTTIQHLTDFVVAWERCGGDDLGLSANPRWYELLDSRPWFIGGDGKVINVSNCRDTSPEYCFPGGYWWAAKCDRSDWAGFEDAHQKPWRSKGLFHDVQAFWLRRPHQASTTPPVAGLRRLEGLQWAFFHGVGARAPWLMLRAGSNGGNHNHRDLGNLVLGYGPDRLLSDAGYGAGATAVHTAVTCGGDQTIDATAPLVRSRELPGGCYLACDLEACYPHRLAWHRRHVLLLPGGQLLVVDDIRGRHGRRPSARSHVLSDLPATVDGHDVVFTGAAGRYRLRPLVEALPPTVETWSHHHEHRRVELRTAVDRVHTQLAWILGPDDELLRGATWEHDGLRGSLRLGDQRADIDLARGDLVEAGEA